MKNLEKQFGFLIVPFSMCFLLSTVLATLLIMNTGDKWMMKIIRQFILNLTSHDLFSFVITINTDIKIIFISLS